MLAGHPDEFDPLPTADFPESPRLYMRQQADRLIYAADGRGAPFLSAEEYERVVAVWSKGENRAPITKFSAATYAEIMHAEERIRRRLADSNRLVDE